jgi:hypothetical protein
MPLNCGLAAIWCPFGFLIISLIDTLIGALSRAVTVRAGGAQLEPIVAESTLPALSGNPTNIIDRGWGEDMLYDNCIQKGKATLNCPITYGRGV